MTGHRNRALLAVAAVGMLGALASGCSAAAPVGGGVAAAPAAVPLPGKPVPADVCTLVTPAEVAQVLGSGPVTAKPGDADPTHPDVRRCYWSTADKSVDASLMYNASVADTEQFKAQLADPTFMPKSRVDVGDGAIDTSFLGLEVLVGDVGLLVEGPKAHEVELAKLLVSKLR